MSGAGRLGELQGRGMGGPLLDLAALDQGGDVAVLNGRTRHNYDLRTAGFRADASKRGVRRPWLAGSLQKIKCVDANQLETVANMVTCVAYNIIAEALPRAPKGGEEKATRKARVALGIYRVALHALGVVAFAYHYTSPEHTPGLRHVSRRLDYCAVGAAHTAFTLARRTVRALITRKPSPQALPSVHSSSHSTSSQPQIPSQASPPGAPAPDNGPLSPVWLTVVSSVLLPYQPYVVIGAHILFTELAMAEKVREAPKSAVQVHKQHMQHSLTGLAAFACFESENAFETFPGLHAAWHLLGALAIHCANQALLKP